jgi:type VI secretion system protein ImpG
VPFNEHYQDELDFLHKLGAEFARANPQLAPFLTGDGNDPDVERLLEGFAFLTGRIRQKLDDELPELTHSLISLLWPHFLRPVPSMAILQFQPIPRTISEKKRILRGTEVDSVPVEGTPCRFQTCYDVDLYPLNLDSVEVQRAGTSSSLKLGLVLHPGVALDAIQLDSLRLYLHGDSQICQSLYLWLCKHLADITVQAGDKGKSARRLSLPATALRQVGFDEKEGLLPYPPNAFLGYRLLQEYFALPQKFLFVDITELKPVSRLDITERFEITLGFTRPLSEQVRLSKNNILLYCAPIVNLFPKDADPIRLEHDKTEYRIRPAVGNRDPDHYEIYAVDQVVGAVQGGREKHEYQPFLSFDPSGIDAEQTLHYRTKLVPAVIGRGADTYMSFVAPRHKGVLPATETVSIQLTCTNRHLPEKLAVGDIAVPTGNSPEFARFLNITPPTPSVLPPLDRGLHWQLISNMALNYISLVNVKALRIILSTYNFQAFYDLQLARAHELRLDGIELINAQPGDKIFKGAPIRGLRLRMDMRQSRFAGEGDLYLLASVLNEFFALYTTINSFHELQVRNVERGEVYQWPARIGQQPIL